MSQQLIRDIEQEYLKTDRPAVYPGDTVKVMVRIKEGNKERLQAFEGVVLRVRGGGINKTFSVRKVFQGVSVERNFFFHSPRVDSIKVIRRGKVRRSRLYYLRDRIGKSARIREKTTGCVAPGKDKDLHAASSKKKAAKAAKKAEKA